MFRVRMVVSLLALSMAGAACSSDDNDNPINPPLNRSDSGGERPDRSGGADVQTDMPPTDSGSDAASDSATDGANSDDDLSNPDSGSDAGDSGANPDGGESLGCLEVQIDQAFAVTLADDVSIEYSTSVSPDIEGSQRLLSFLFERYQPGPDVGVFDLSEDPDSNFGNCGHCVFIRTNTRERVYFAERGTLELKADPYRRELDLEVTHLRLIESRVDPVTRASTPIEGGRCLEVAAFAAQGVFPPTEWSCPADQYQDGQACHCGCGAIDPDCNAQGGCDLFDPQCVPGDPLPVANCQASEVCAFEPVSRGSECMERCDWQSRSGCTATATCVFDFGVGQGDLCIDEPTRIAPGIEIGETCPSNGLQLVCNVVNGFANGYCDSSNTCRAICQTNSECVESGHTCRKFSDPEGLGYCGPEPMDDDG